MIYEMSIADILKLPSVDSDGAGCGSGHSWSVESVIGNVRVDQYEYPAIMAEMKHDGYNRVPLHVDIGERMAGFYYAKIPSSMLSMLFMGNGHHRLKMMIMLGFDTARVTDDPSESDDTGDEMYVNGYGYEDEEDYDV